MPYTQAQLVNAVYAELSVDAEAVPSEDSAAITSRLADVVADLAARRITGTITLSAVADSIFTDLVKVLAERCAPFFGRATNAQALEAAEARLGQSFRLDRTLSTAFVRSVLDRLDALGATTNAMDATAVSGLVQSVLDDLAIRRVAVIANEAAITTAQSRHVVTLVAARAVPRAVDPALVAEAEAKLREADRLNRATGTALEQAVLERLGALGALTDAIDRGAVTNAIQRTLDDLAATRVITIAADGFVGSKHFPHVVTLVAALVEPKAVPPQSIVDAKDALASIARLDRTVSTPLIRGVLQQLAIWNNGSMAVDATAVSDSFTGIFASLALRNVYYIPDAADVPDAALPALTRLVAAWLAPKPMGDIIMQAERELRRLGMEDGTGEILTTDYF